MTVRSTFDNPLPPGGRRLMSPGMFVHIRLPIGQARDSLLVADRAIGSDQGLKFVYVVNADNKIEYRRVTTGALEEDGLRVVETGIKNTEWVVVGGLQQVRPRMVVEPERTQDHADHSNGRGRPGPAANAAQTATASSESRGQGSGVRGNRGQGSGVRGQGSKSSEGENLQRAEDSREGRPPATSS